MREGVFPSEQKFAYRQNQDGTIDSICLLCYRTVCSATSKDGLGDGERMHKCLLIDLDWWWQRTDDWKTDYT